MTDKEDRFFKEWCGSVYYLAVLYSEKAIPKYKVDQLNHALKLSKDTKYNISIDDLTLKMVVKNERVTIEYFNHIFESEKRLVNVERNTA
jgi:hypothetical protein